MPESMKKTLITATILSLIVFALGQPGQSARAQVRIANTGTGLFAPTAAPPPPAPVTDQSFLAPQKWATELSLKQAWGHENPRMLADVNGDGKQDIVGFGNDGVWLATSTGTQFDTHFVLADFGYHTGWRRDKHVRTTGDINGDKLEDIVGFGDAGVYRALSTGTGFGVPTFVIANFGYNQGWRVDKHVRLLADVNGDGLKDIVAFGDDGVWLSFATPGGYFTPPAFVLANFGYKQGWTNSHHIRTTADVNGDGRQDIVAFGDDGVWIALSTGTGFAPEQFVLADFGYHAGNWSVANHPRLLVDMDRDGKADIVGFGDAGVWIARSTGNGFAPAQFVLANFGYNQGWHGQRHPRFVADLNGDGYMDIVGYGEDAVYRALGGPGWFGPVRGVLRALVPALARLTTGYLSQDFANPDLFPRFVGDVNGDGKQDLVATDGAHLVVAPSTALPPPPPPKAPSNPRIVPAYTTSSSLYLAWDDNNNDERQFLINYYRQGSNLTQEIATGDYGPPSDATYPGFVFNSLASDATYCFNVQAESMWGVSDSTSTQCGRTKHVVTITTSSALPAGQVGSAYSQTLAASGGIPPYAWAVISGSLPNGLTLNSSGVLSGTPSAAGSFHFTVQVRDSQPTTTSRDFSLTINALAGFSSVAVFNCNSEGGSVNVWTQDLAQGYWVERGTAPALWNAGTCPGSAAPFVVPLQDGHRFWFAVVDPQLPACGVDNPAISACQRQIFTSPLIGNAKGPALPDRVD